MNSKPSQRHNNAAPPPVKTNRAQTVVLIGSVCVIAALLGVVILNLEKGEAQSKAPPPSELITELIAPPSLTEQDLTSDVTDFGRDTQTLGAEGGWIQVTDEGRLSQQYRFQRLEPNPEDHSAGWLKMHEPEVELYFDERVITLSGSTALAHAPSRALESGTISDGVVIRLYERDSDESFDALIASPIMEVRTEEASFDNIQGEIRCDGPVDIQTNAIHVPGNGLRLQLNEIENRAEWLRIEDVGPIRIVQRVERSSQTDVEPANRDDSRKSSQPKNKRDLSPEERAAKREEKVSEEFSDVQFYQLTLHKNIHIQQGQSANAWNITGDEVHIVFSTHSEGMSDMFAFSATTHDRGTNWHSALSLLMFSLLSDSPVPGLYKSNADEIIITCDGGLTLTPLADDSELPKSPDAAFVEIIGQPVHLHHATDSISVQCHSMQYDSQNGRIELVGSNDLPLELESPQFLASAPRLWLNRNEQAGAFVGPGWLSAVEQSREDAKLRINWDNRVEFQFEVEEKGSQESIGALRQAVFDGNVGVTSDEVELVANSLSTSFVSDTQTNTSGGRRLESATATGNVRAKQKGEAGSLSADHVHVSFVQTQDNSTSPSNLIAKGNVEAADPEGQTVWADELHATFATVRESSGRADIEQLNATGNVQVMTADGARVFADSLNADSESQLAVLEGDDLMVASDQAMIDQGSRLELHQADEKVVWPNAGRFVYFAESPWPTTQTKINRPVINLDQTKPQMTMSWNESLTYKSQETGVETVIVTGDVLGESTPTNLEHNTFLGNELTLEFTQSDREQSESNQTMLSGGRELSRLIATGNAKLENYAWLQEDHADTPRVFYIAGDYISYDAETLESVVRGKGELLVRDERVEGDVPPESTPFSAQGTSHFRWSERLVMTRQSETDYDISMIGDVEVRHRAIDRSISTLTSKQLEAGVVRSIDEKLDGGALDLGGSMDLTRLTGRGAVYIDSPTRDIDCEEFVYDYETGIAELLARPGGKVTITSSTQPHPVRAEQITWNLIDDTITATKITGAAGSN